MMLNLFQSIGRYFHPAVPPDYRKRLYENLKMAKDENRIVSFKIHGLKPDGFLIHVGGLFGFVHFRHFLWRYDRKEYWQAVSRHLAGHRFPGRIYELSFNPIRVVVDGVIESIYSPRLVNGDMVDVVVLAKNKSGLVVDAGFQFNWKCGSVIGFIYKDAFLNVEEYETAEPGQLLPTCYLGRNHDDRLVFGDVVTNPAVITPGIENLVGDTREVVIVKQPDGQQKYFVDGTYPATMPLNRLFYPGCKKKAKAVIDSLRDQDRIECEIVSYSPKRHMFRLKLVNKILGTHANDDK